MNNDVTMAGESERALLASRYRIIKQLGQGGMGSVWLAEDTLLDGKLFAIKMLPSILVSNKRAYNQLKAEALVSMKLTHPNIVTLRAFEENNGNPFLVMDYIDGQTLDDYLAEKGARTADETIELLKPVAYALDYAHGEGVVHRDVKPANVMIRKDGHPFVLDFGIAREIQETMTRVTGKLSSGTLLYMSPEQLNGASPKKEQDIYSFAAMAYECLKGNPPFHRGQIEHQILNNLPEPLDEGEVSVPSSVVPGVMAGLAKKPEDRPKTCVSVLAGENFNAEKQRREEAEPDGNVDGRECAKPEKHAETDSLGSVFAAETNKHESGNKKELPFGFLDLAIGFILVIIFALSIWKWRDVRQKFEQNEKRQTAVAETKRLAIEARNMAATAQTNAEKAGARRLAGDKWNEALIKKSAAESAWHTRDYIKSKEYFLDVAKLFGDSARVAEAVEDAQKDKELQRSCQSRSGEQRTKNIKSELRVTARLGENTVYGAKINDGVKDYITPIFWTLEKGKTYGPYTVIYERNGKKYSGKFDAVTVDWNGLKKMEVVLTEEVVSPFIDRSYNTRKAIEAFNAKRYGEALQFAMRADVNNAEIQYIIGYGYLYGIGVPKNKSIAMLWCRKAAEQGNVKAQNRIACDDRNGCKSQGNCTSNQFAANEKQRCISLISHRFYEAWTDFDWSENLQSVHLLVKFGVGGRITGYRIVQSSGDMKVDQSVLMAAKRVGYVAGLSNDFLNKYPEIVIEMKPKRQEDDKMHARTS